MVRGDRPTFTVVVAAEAIARRLVSVETVRALTGLAEADVSDETLGLKIDGALALCARSCRLARAGALPLTLAQEEARATWPDAAILGAGWSQTWLPNGRSHELLLPWRAPITDLTVTEGETELEQDVDFRYLGAGLIERMSGGAFCGWSTGAIVVDYTAGFVTTPQDLSAEVDGEPMPADLLELVADQVKLAVFQIDNDPSLRSENVPGVWSGAYNIAGGDAIASSGLTRPLWEALVPYRAPPLVA